MSTRINPFHAYLGNGKRRTLAEIEAANNRNRPNPFQALHGQPVQPVRGLGREKVSEWLSRQEVHLGEEDFSELDRTTVPRSFRRTTDSVREGGNGQISPAPHRRPVQAGATAKPSFPPRHTPSSLNFSSTGLKRKASDLDDSDDVIIVQPPPSTLRRTPRTTAFIDLTESDGEKRQTSFRGHRDDDVIIIDPPAAEMRRQLRPLLLGTPRGSNTRAANVIRGSAAARRHSQLLGTPRNPDDGAENIDPPAARHQSQLLGTPRNPDTGAEDIDPPAARHQIRPPLLRTPRDADTRAQKRLKQTHTGETSAIQRLLPRNADEAADAAIVPEANVAEDSVSLQSVELVNHFFRLATEIRDKIYRHLLVSQKPITVQNLWKELARRSARRGRSSGDVGTTIDIRVLSVCRRTAIEGTRVLYSENSFLYMLRDSHVAMGSGIRGATSTINLVKYGHLIRHMTIELEPNRTGPEYEKLMSTALETLAPADADSPLHPPPRRPLCGPIHLHTLTITVSPLLQSSLRTIRAAAQGVNQDKVIYDGRFFTVVDFFSRGKRVLKALQRLNIDFLRINVHVNSDATSSRSGNANQNTSDSDPSFSDDYDSDEYDTDDSEASTAHAHKQRRHLETTIDLRYLPRHMETLRRESFLGQLWQNDELMPKKRAQQAADAEKTLGSLRRHIEDACMRPERALREGIWEDHCAAERRRREQRAKEEVRFDGDKVDRSYGDGRIVRGMKSLIISIDRVGDELRAYRA